MTGLSDSFQRPINYLRVSVTDRCNLRCRYCMPPEGVHSIPHHDILSYEEIHTVVLAATELGINKVRITGGEPLVRLGLTKLIRMLAQVEAIDDISLTTNGLLLSRHAAELKQAGLGRVNVSLDTLKPDKFKSITGSDRFSDVLKGIEVARPIGLNPVKINVVVMAGTNDDELLDFARKTIEEEWHVRFIEIMPFTSEGATAAKVLSAREMKKRLDPLGKMEPFMPDVGSGPARYFRLPGARGTVGFITPVSEHFCVSCNRLRLTADGKLRPCLFSKDEIDLRQALREGLPPDGLKELIKQAVDSKPQCHYLAEGYVHEDRPFCQVGG